MWKRARPVAVVALIGGAFLAGYLPERRVRVAAEQQSEALQQRLAAAETRLRIGRLLGDALTLSEVAMRRNYGQAQELSSAFFDRVRVEATETGDEAFRRVLTDILARRDAVTIALTKAEPAVVDVLHAIELALRRALGYLLPPDQDPTGPPASRD